MKRLRHLPMLALLLVANLGLSACAATGNAAEEAVGETGSDGEPPAPPAIRLWVQEEQGFRSLDLEELVTLALDYDVIAFGEFHGNPAAHAFEEAFLKAIVASKPNKVALALEQFERDVQATLSGYLDGSISEEAFLAASRPWPNYADYRPLIEFAKSSGFPVLAANCPRPLAARIFREGSLAVSQLSHQERSWLATRITPGDGRYALKLKGFMGHGAPAEAPQEGVQSRIDRFIWAQCVKDDTMAESIINYQRLNPGHTVVFYAGAFHVEEGLGAIERILSREPQSRILVVASSMDEAFAQGGSEPNADDAVRAKVILRVPLPQPTERQ